MFGNNAAGPQNFQDYSAVALRDDAGREVYYRLTSPIDGQVTVTLNAPDDDLDLIVVGSEPDDTCTNPTASYLAASQTSGTEQVNVDVVRDAVYYPHC